MPALAIACSQCILAGMSGHVVVIGSVNVDLVVASDRLPRPGETVLGGRFAVHDGGKGANQAVAAARAGARVTMIGAVGSDAHGERSIAALEAEGIDTSRIRRIDDAATGVAIIAVGPRGENQIVVAPGANGRVTLDDPDRELIGQADALLTNHEIPPETTLDALRAAHAAGVTAILNPAPARALPSEVLSLGPILTPNEHELIVAIGNDETGAALDELARGTPGRSWSPRGRPARCWSTAIGANGSTAVPRPTWWIQPAPAIRSAGCSPRGWPTDEHLTRRSKRRTPPRRCRYPLPEPATGCRDATRSRSYLAR